MIDVMLVVPAAGALLAIKLWGARIGSAINESTFLLPVQLWLGMASSPQLDSKQSSSSHND